MVKKWLVSLSLISAIGFIANANADVYSTTTLSYGLTQDTRLIQRDPFENEFPTAFDFSEIFSIKLTDSKYISAFITEDKRSSLYDIEDTSLSYGLFKITGNTSTAIALNNATLYSVGDYELRVFGTVTGEEGGQYFLNINIASTPVPEPSASFAMLIGLGLISLVLKSKSRII